MQNNVEIFRTDDNRMIKAFSVDIGANRQGYLWHGNLSLPFSEFEKVMDTPEIEININQYKFVVDINNLSIHNQLINISVSSTTNRLKMIKAYKVDYEASSIAIMSSQLSRVDLETGFKFSGKNSVDWMIPNNVIEYDEAFVLDIINIIALAVGSVVISHAHNKEIIVKDKYTSSQPIYCFPLDKQLSSGIVCKKDNTIRKKIMRIITDKLMAVKGVAHKALNDASFHITNQSMTIDVESILFQQAPMIYPSDVIQIGSDIGWVDDVSIKCQVSHAGLIIRHTMSIEKRVD